MGRSSGITAFGALAPGVTVCGLVAFGLRALGLVVFGLTATGLMVNGVAAIGLGALGMVVNGSLAFGTTEFGIQAFGAVGSGKTVKDLAVIGLVAHLIMKLAGVDSMKDSKSEPFDMRLAQTGYQVEAFINAKWQPFPKGTKFSQDPISRERQKIDVMLPSGAERWYPINSLRIRHKR